MVHEASRFNTSLKVFSPSGNQNECSSATPRSKSGCTDASHEVGKWTWPSFSGGRPPSFGSSCDSAGSGAASSAATSVANGIGESWREHLGIGAAIVSPEFPILATLSPALAPFRVASFRFQWPADLATSLAFEMEALILGWYVLTATGSVQYLVAFAALAW